MSNLVVRSLVALVGIPVILAFSLLGGFYFFLLIAFISAVCLVEFYRLAGGKGVSPQVLVGLIFGLCVNAAFIHGRLQYVLAEYLSRCGCTIPLATMPQVLLITLLLFFSLVPVLELFRQKESAFLNIASTLFGVMYVSLFLGSLIGLRELFRPDAFPVSRYFDVRGIDIPGEVVGMMDQWGGWTVVAVFSSIWLCDSAAYFGGRAFGRNRLFERISPHKTWEGAVAGFLAAVGVFLVAREIVLPYLSFVDAAVCGVLVGVFGQVGDLVESMLKRDSGLKDSSALIPGHGGMFDRFDSLILVSPVLFLYFDFIVFAR